MYIYTYMHTYMHARIHTYNIMCVSALEGRNSVSGCTSLPERFVNKQRAWFLKSSGAPSYPNVKHGLTPYRLFA